MSNRARVLKYCLGSVIGLVLSAAPLPQAQALETAALQDSYKPGEILMNGAVVNTVLEDGTAVIMPESSQIKSGDKGIRAHTHYQIVVPPKNKLMLGLNTETGPHTGTPSPGSNYEIPASIACIYKLVSPLSSGCNPNVASVNPTGGHGAIAIVDAYHNPTSTTDIATFSQQFGLPAADFTVVYAGGSQPTVDSGWAVESSLDIEWAHAMAPQAKIYLIEAADNNLSSLFSGVSLGANLVAAAGGGTVSMSWGSGEFSSESFGDNNFTQPGVVYIASTGDVPGTEYPSVSPNVVAAGGTNISRDGSGNFASESAWVKGGGGASAYLPRPSYQSPVSGITGPTRGVPDLSADADPASPVWIFAQGSWSLVGGTSVAAPTIAGMINAGGATLTTSPALLTNLYINRNVTGTFTDITTGNCGTHAAATDWDFCTGVGSPLGYSGLGGPAAVNGTCGSANNVAVSSTPSSGLCSAGSASSVSGSGPWAWTCNGSNGGSTVSCAAPLSSAVNGTCGAANGTTLSSAPTANLCNAGSASSVNGTGPWTWSCVGTNGGTNASCSAALQTTMLNISVAASADAYLGNPLMGLNINGSQVATSTVSTLHSSGQWQIFTFSVPITTTLNNFGISFQNDAYGGSTDTDRNLWIQSITINGQTAVPAQGIYVVKGVSAAGAPLMYNNGTLTWQANALGACVGVNGGTVASCSGTVDGLCGIANTVAVSQAPTANLCMKGSPTAITGTGPWNWTCKGINGGLTPSCSAPLLPINGACGASNGATLASAPTTGLCSTGIASSVTGAGPWNWTCAGNSSGTVASCSAQPQAPATMTITVSASGDDYLGTPLMKLLVNGAQVGANTNVTALHSSGQWQTLTFTLPVPTSLTSVGVGFLNDAWGGSTATDCNLWIQNVSVNGITLLPAQGTYVTTKGVSATGQQLMYNNGTLSWTGAVLPAAH